MLFKLFFNNEFCLLKCCVVVVKYKNLFIYKCDELF